MNTQKQILLIVVLFFVMVGGCAAYTVIELPVRAVDQTVWHKDQSIERGALLFANNCRTCHGIQGQGGVGLPLNTAAFQNQDPLVLKNNLALLKRTLYCGRAGTRMPAWLNTNGGSLNERQVEHLLDFITDPATKIDAEGNPTSSGWELALEFAHNLNRESVVVVGGDTLDTIAKDHQLGVQELVALNVNIDADQVLSKGAKINLPEAVGRPGGREFQVRKDKETLRKIADSQHVGAALLADLNQIPYTIDETAARLTLKVGTLSRTAGLIPFLTLRLPADAIYVIKPGDTPKSIADRHGLSESALSTALATVETKTVDGASQLVADRKLKLPAGAVAVVQVGQTGATIATAHGITIADLKTEADVALTVETAAALGPGQRLKLPAGTKYFIQTGDTLAAVAAAHGMTEADLASLNELKPGQTISPLVVVAFPKVDKYLIAGQTLEDVAKGYSNVTADTLAQANPPAQANSVFAVGTTLTLPADAWGSAPPDAINNGSACIEHAVPDSVYKTINGSAPAAPATKPTVTSKTVELDSNANDWTVKADGVAQPANKGVALIAKGTSVNFKNIVGVHTITINAKKDTDFKGADKKDIPFNDAGTFTITCDIHPAMKATIFVE